MRDYEVGKFTSGCCGCVALYYSLFDEKGITKQIIFETACGIGKPTVFHFTRGAKGDIQGIKRFIAVRDSTAEFRFDKREKKVLAKLDSIALADRIRISNNFKFAELVGYRRESTDEQFHPFWIDEKGKTKLETSK